MLKQTSLTITIGGIDNLVYCDYCSDTGIVVSAQYGNGKNVEIDDSIREMVSDYMIFEIKKNKRKRRVKK